MRQRRLEHGREILGRRDVRDRVVHEHRVERPTEPDGAHVALDVLTFGIEPTAHRQHRRRSVDERQSERALEVRGVVAAAASQLEDVPHARVARPDQDPSVLLGLGGVVLGGRQQRPPVGELSVEPGEIGHRVHILAPSDAAL
jgi:hypothetical protein